jgi:histone-binding protein RBBP4
LKIFKRVMLRFRSVPGRPFSTHRLIIGTQTSGQAQNYVQIAKVEWPNPTTAQASDFNADTGEIGGHGNAKHPITFNVIQRINHPGDVNKARYQPQNPNIIATMCQDGNALVFDRSKLSSSPKEDGTVEAHVVLKGHTKEGYGLSWNKKQEGILATGAEDATVRMW